MSADNETILAEVNDALRAELAAVRSRDINDLRRRVDTLTLRAYGAAIALMVCGGVVGVYVMMNVIPAVLAGFGVVALVRGLRESTVDAMGDDEDEDDEDEDDGEAVSTGVRVQPERVTTDTANATDTADDSDSARPNGARRSQ